MEIVTLTLNEIEIRELLKVIERAQMNARYKWQEERLEYLYNKINEQYNKTGTGN